MAARVAALVELAQKLRPSKSPSWVEDVANPQFDPGLSAAVVYSGQKA